MSAEIVKANNVNEFNALIQKFKKQIDLVLPKHLSADRMCRLALTCFSTSEELRKCSFNSILSSIITASQLGLEIGVGGQGYLIPYKGTCTFVPGWKGLMDIVSRSGRAMAWTGAVYEGDFFEYSKGTDPRINHRENGEDDPEKLTHVYAVGRVNGSEYPIIEVWSAEKVKKHFNKHNKVGLKHYAHKNWEMYARKVVLLQVLKYLPASIELTAATELSHAQEDGRNATLSGDFTVVDVDGHESSEDEQTILQALREASFSGQAALMAKLAEFPDSEAKSAVWKREATSLLNSVKEIENGATV